MLTPFLHYKPRNRINHHQVQFLIYSVTSLGRVFLRFLINPPENPDHLQIEMQCDTLIFKDIMNIQKTTTFCLLDLFLEFLTMHGNKLRLFYARELFLLLVQNTAVVGATFDVISYNVVLFQIRTNYLSNDKYKNISNIFF